MDTRIAAVTGALAFVLVAAILSGGFGHLTHSRPPTRALPGQHAGCVGDFSKDTQAPTKDLAQALFGCVSTQFVADSRSFSPPMNGAAFYESPKPFGESLCSVITVTFDTRVVVGNMASYGNDGQPDIAANYAYGIRVLPHEAMGADGTRTCARFRDFRRLISGRSGIAIERAVNLVDEVVERAKSGRVTFTVECVDGRGASPKRCDGVALLRTVDPYAISQVENLVETRGSGSTRRIDRVDMQIRPPGSCGEEEYLTLEVGSTQTYGRQSATEGDPTDVNLLRSVFC